MSDHHHYGEYAEARHDHDVDYADKHHGHYDLDREDERLKALLELLRHEVRELREDLRSALGRIRLLEQQAPQARQLQYEADQAAADLAESGFDWHDDNPEAVPFTAVPRLRRIREDDERDRDWS